MKGMVDAWKEKPAALQKEVADFQPTAQNLAAIDVNGLNEQLEAKKKELTDALTNAGKAAVEDAASKAAKNVLKKLF